MNDAHTSGLHHREPGTTARAGRNLALQSRRTLDLAELLDRRPDLRGVSTWSEEIALSVLWSA